MKPRRRRLEKLTEAAKKAAARVESRRKRGPSKRFRTILHALNYYCTHTTFHGLRYVVDPDLHAVERLLWLVLFAASSIVASKVIYTLALSFQVTAAKQSYRFTRYIIARDDSSYQLSPISDTVRRRYHGDTIGSLIGLCGIDITT